MDTWTLIAIIANLMILSFFYYKDNFTFKLANELLMGITLAHFFITSLQNIDKLALTPLMGGNILVLIPLILGITIFTRFTPKYRQYALWPIAVILGVGLGIALRGSLGLNLANQITATMKIPLFGIAPFDMLSNLIFIVSVLATIYYFTFARRTREGGLSKLSTIGRYLILISMGAIFGSTSMTRFAYLIGRVTFLLQSVGLI